MTVAAWYRQANEVELLEHHITYRMEGSGVALLCIHGFPSSSWDFEKIWPIVTKRLQVIAPDLLGLGKSSKPNQALPVRLQADLIEALLLSLQVSKAHLLAHDLGDTIAQELIARQIEGSGKIQWLSCTLLNGGIFPETHRPLLIQKLLISPLGSLLVHLMSEKTFGNQMTRVFSNEHPPSADFIRETWKLILSNGGRQAIPRLIRYMSERRANRERWVGALINSPIPLQLINGLADPISGAHAADRYEELIPNARVVRLKHSGHYPHLETPQDVTEALLSFLTS